MTSAFRTGVSAALARPRARANIRRAMLGLQQKRLAAFPDTAELERLRAQGQAIRDEALARLPELLEQLEARCIANGIQVHWAEDAAAANRLIIDLLAQRNAEALLKGKSMVSEEIGLNAALEQARIAPIETDLGELIIQLAGDHPSHIVAPAVHKDRDEVARLFAERLESGPAEMAPSWRQAPAGSAGYGAAASLDLKTAGPDAATENPAVTAGQGATTAIPGAVASGPDATAASPDTDPRLTEIERLTAQARAVMRRQFKQVRAGLSGVNFAVAETGTLCLVENEGNGRLTTTAPDLHIAIMGIEKVIACLDQLAPLLTLLTRSATGQAITTYVNLISGPRRPGERDGPSELHLVLLDNGRARIHADPELRETLRCIRCGACMNHCPVYTRIGGHGYGTVYPGPLGAILEPQLQGLDAQGELAEASSLCGACAEVCPVRIPIPRLLNRLRHERAEGRAVPGSRRPGLQRWLWGGWAWFYRRAPRYRALRWLAAGPLRGLAAQLPVPGWTPSRAVPPIATRSLHQLAARAGYADASGSSVASPGGAPGGAAG